MERIIMIIIMHLDVKVFMQKPKVIKENEKKKLKIQYYTIQKQSIETLIEGKKYQKKIPFVFHDTNALTFYYSQLYCPLNIYKYILRGENIALVFLAVKIVRLK